MLEDVASLIPDTVPAYMRLTELPPRTYIPERYELGFQTEGLHPCVNEAHRAVQWWLNDILHGCKERRRWLTLYGRSGVGKSHLAITAHNVLKNAEKRAQKWNFARLRTRLLDGDWPGLLEQVQKMPYLVLDDVGAEYTESEKSRAVSASILYEILEARLGRWTLITSNLAPSDMADVRITSRLFRGHNELVDMSKAMDYCYQLKNKAT